MQKHNFNPIFPKTHSGLDSRSSAVSFHAFHFVLLHICKLLFCVTNVLLNDFLQIVTVQQ